MDYYPLYFNSNTGRWNILLPFKLPSLDNEYFWDRDLVSKLTQQQNWRRNNQTRTLVLQIVYGVTLDAPLFCAILFSPQAHFLSSPSGNAGLLGICNGGLLGICVKCRELAQHQITDEKAEQYSHTLVLLIHFEYCSSISRFCERDSFVV